MKLKFLKLYKAIKFGNDLQTQFQPKKELPGLEMTHLPQGLINIKTDHDSVLVSMANVEYAREEDAKPKKEEKPKPQREVSQA